MENKVCPGDDNTVDWNKAMVGQQAVLPVEIGQLEELCLKGKQKNHSQWGSSIKKDIG